MSGAAASALPTLYTIAEAATALRVPEGWLRKKVTARLVPHTRLGKHVRFTDEHLRSMLQDGEVQQQTSATPAVTGGVSPRARHKTTVAARA